MKIILDQNENEEVAYIFIKELVADPNKWDRLRNDLIWKTEMSKDELDLLISIYIQ